MIEIAYRTWLPTVPSPRKLRAEIPGWGGDRDMEAAQPWHCKPFLDGNTLGIELYWGLATTVVVTGDGVDAQIEGDIEPITRTKETISQFARGHYGVNSNYHIRLPPGWGMLVLPHPSWSLDPYNSDRPAVIPGLIEAAWWPHLFFVVSRIPPVGIRHVYRYGEPFCQVLPMPLDMDLALREMSEPERVQAMELEAFCKAKYPQVSTRVWTSNMGHEFGNIYKVLSKRFLRGKRVDWDAVRREAAAREAGEAEGPEPGPGA